MSRVPEFPIRSAPTENYERRRYRECTLLTRSIDLYQDDFTTEEKIFRAAKRVCAIFAVTALTLSVLDLMNIRSVEAAAEFIHNNRDKIADLPGTITTEIRRMASLPPSDSDSLSASVVVAIPRSQ